MTREEIEKRADSVSVNELVAEQAVIDFAIEISNAQIDAAISRVKQSMIGPIEKEWILKGLESLKIKP